MEPAGRELKLEDAIAAARTKSWPELAGSVATIAATAAGVPYSPAIGKALSWWLTSPADAKVVEDSSAWERERPVWELRRELVRALGDRTDELVSLLAQIFAALSQQLSADRAATAQHVASMNRGLSLLTRDKALPRYKDDIAAYLRKVPSYLALLERLLSIVEGWPQGGARIVCGLAQLGEIRSATRWLSVTQGGPTDEPVIQMFIRECEWMIRDATARTTVLAAVGNDPALPPESRAEIAASLYRPNQMEAAARILRSLAGDERVTPEIAARVLARFRMVSRLGDRAAELRAALEALGDVPPPPGPFAALPVEETGDD